MRRDVAAGSRVSVFEPSPANVGILVVHHNVNILAVLLDLVGHHDARYAGAQYNRTELPSACTVVSPSNIHEKIHSVPGSPNRVSAGS